MNEKFNLFLECITVAKDDNEFKQLLQDNFEDNYIVLCLKVLNACKEFFNVNIVSIIRATNEVFNEVSKRNDD